MPIPSQTIVDRCLAALDAEGSDRYLWARDFQPAISYANEWMISLFNAVFAAKKLSEEVLTENTRVRIWQASLYSRVAFDATIVGENYWTILGVFPKIVSIPTSPILAAAADESVYRSDISFRSSSKSAKRITIEQWNERGRNMFMPGSGLITYDELVDYAYLNFADYTGGYSLVNSNFEIEISPAIPGELVAIAYLKLPDAPVNIVDDLEFPANLTDMIVNETLNFIAVKQGDAESLYNLSSNNINQLINLMT